MIARWRPSDRPTRRADILRIAAIAGSIGLVAGGIAGFALSFLNYVIGPIFGLAVAAWAGGILGWNRWQAREREIREHLGAEPGDTSVGLRIRILGEHNALVAVGEDDGILAIVDGWLVFRGLRSEWAIRPGDAEPDGQLLRFDGPAGKTEVRFSGEVGLTLRLWSRGSAGEGPSVFPPSLPERVAAGMGRLEKNYLSGIVALIMITACMIASRSFAGWPALIYLAGTMSNARKTARAERPLLAKVREAMAAAVVDPAESFSPVGRKGEGQKDQKNEAVPR